MTAEYFFNTLSQVDGRILQMVPSVKKWACTICHWLPRCKKNKMPVSPTGVFGWGNAWQSKLH